ncbi:hypothetical protein V8D89_002572 [Ganoderma adspersum]
MSNTRCLATDYATSDAFVFLLPRVISLNNLDFLAFLWIFASLTILDIFFAASLAFKFLASIAILTTILDVSLAILATLEMVLEVSLAILAILAILHTSFAVLDAILTILNASLYSLIALNTRVTLALCLTCLN